MADISDGVIAQSIFQKLKRQLAEEEKKKPTKKPRRSKTSNKRAERVLSSTTTRGPHSNSTTSDANSDHNLNTNFNTERISPSAWTQQQRIRKGHIGGKSLSSSSTVKTCMVEECISERVHDSEYCPVHLGAPKPCNFVGCNLSDPFAQNGFCGIHRVKPCAIENCNRFALVGSAICKRHGRTPRCKHQNCLKATRNSPNGFCVLHGGRKRKERTRRPCEFDGCVKGCINGYSFCRAHGGGRRCQRRGCKSGAESSTDFCIRHGGGKRCQIEGCNTGARGSTGFCTKHGGGRRCEKPDCFKSAEPRYKFCRSHGGGKRCQYPACDKGVERSQFCVKHGGGIRCQLPFCRKHARPKSRYCKDHRKSGYCEAKGCLEKKIVGNRPFCLHHGGGHRCGRANCLKLLKQGQETCDEHKCQFSNCHKCADNEKYDYCVKHRCSEFDCSDPVPGESLKYCDIHRIYCEFRNCNTKIRTKTQTRADKTFCGVHKYRSKLNLRECEYEGCIRKAVKSSAEPFCRLHGGGICSHPNCPKLAKVLSRKCIAHGGGKRCEHEGCYKGARGGSSMCWSHGGGLRCSEENCQRKVCKGTNFCRKHSGNRI